MILGPCDLRAAGIAEPFAFGLRDAMRFGEIDALGHVSDAAYFRWFEDARVRYFRHLGIMREGAGAPRIVLRQAEAEFLAEMRMHEAYVVALRTDRVGRTSVHQSLAVLAPDLRARGRCVLVFAQAGAKAPVPESARAALLADAPA